MNVLTSLGGIGSGIADKIDVYMFQGEVEAALYSGSVLRFYVILLMMFVFPFIALVVDKKRKQFPQFILRLHYWGIMFFSYIVFTASSYTLSRNIMLFKMFGVLYFTYALFSCSLGRYLSKFIMYICLFVIVLFPFFLILGKEYMVLNTKVFYSSLIDLININTQPEGY